MNQYLLAAGGLALLGVLAFAGAYYYYRQYRDAKSSVLEEYLGDVEETDGDGVLVSFDAPDVGLGLWGFLTMWYHHARRRKMARKGYVLWHRLDSRLQSPTWVKPTQNGEGIPTVKIDGQPYFFPKDAMVTDQETGAYVAMHREGEADPLNLRDPAYPGLEVDLAERTINLLAEDKPPGFLDDLFGMDQTTLMYGMIAVLFLVYAGYRYMGGAA